MSHKRNTLVIFLGLALIIALGLPWPTAPVQAGPALPPRNPLPSQPPPENDDDDDDDDRLVGAYIELQSELQSPGSGWAVVQWQDSDGNWHDVDGWRGSLLNSSRWWVHPKDFKTGPFRWIVLDRPDGAIGSSSLPFNLPAEANQTLSISTSPE